ncbi:peptide MFS transporter [Komagataeibacter sp. FNDCF1]|uniref:peptide MFS transporter n=1 Tax=Komagataeibacter sp. FNDCF1 TaxID=2878681 RepID=UPI001E3CA123|nr:peptide MFS transporter [Komagataeibacter sp. FNDCF1]MCE2565140.1 peptide MFS transporter [Komagataeibacter sp. FNDCF1]
MGGLGAGSGRNWRRQEILGHPAGLFVLTQVEMWERFSFYGMRALLVLYMGSVLFRPGHGTVFGLNAFCRLLHLDPHAADMSIVMSQVYGLYSGFVYFTPLVGGYLADRGMGKSRLIIAGGILIVAGHLLLPVSGFFLVALLLIAIGTGGIKGNIAAQVGDLYAPGDRRRERGFSIFYMGINIGAALAPVVCAVLVARAGWDAAFMATSVGMIFGVVLYVVGGHFWLPARMLPPPDAPPAPQDGPGGPQGRHAGWLVAGLALSCVFIWISYEQQANSMMRWMVPGTAGVGMVWVQSVPPLVVLLGTPALMAVWRMQARRVCEPSAMRKMTTGMLIILSSQIFLVVLAMVLNHHAPATWTIVMYLVTWEIGDLYFSPAAMGLFSRQGSSVRNSVPMAIWYLTIFAGNITSGWVGMLWGHLAPTPYWATVAVLTAMGVAGIALCRKYMSPAQMGT